MLIHKAKAVNETKIGTSIAVVLTDTPLGIQVGRKHMYLFPQTLGKIYLTSWLIETLEIDRENLKISPLIEALRIVSLHRKECCRIIAYHTLKTKEEVLNARIINKREDYIFNNCDNEDIATLLVAILSENKLKEISSAMKLDTEAERMAKVNAAKDSTNQYIFGGKTIWGSLIDVACERYGWTLDYVVWGISYNNLSLMLKDKVTFIYLSEEERKKAHIPSPTEQIFDGNSKEDIEALIRESEENPV